MVIKIEYLLDKKNKECLINDGDRERERERESKFGLRSSFQEGGFKESHITKTSTKILDTELFKHNLHRIMLLNMLFIGSKSSFFFIESLYFFMTNKLL